MNWRADYIEAARQKAEDALRTARAQVAELKDHQRHIQSQGESISAMRGALGSQQSILDHGVNCLAEYMLGPLGQMLSKKQRQQVKQQVRIS